ncbi:MAG: hypothetical protein V1724_06605, partial [Chloroflexota bacterium]
RRAAGYTPDLERLASIGIAAHGPTYAADALPRLSAASLAGTRVFPGISLLAVCSVATKTPIFCSVIVAL